MYLCVISLALHNILPKIEHATSSVNDIKIISTYCRLYDSAVSNSHFFPLTFRIDELIFLVSCWCAHNKQLQAMNDDGLLKLTFQRLHWNTDLSFACELACKVYPVWNSECYNMHKHTKWSDKQKTCKCNHPNLCTTIVYEDIDVMHA